jgi:hypothetical protein
MEKGDEIIDHRGTPYEVVGVDADMYDALDLVYLK